MSNKTTLKNTFTHRMAKLERSARIGWWETDSNKEFIIVSEYLVDLFNLETPYVTLSILRKYIVPEYQRDILFELILARKSHYFNQTFQVQSRYGKIWIKAELSGEEQIGNNQSILLGYIQYIDMPETNGNTRKRLANLLNQQNMISRSLLSLLHTNDMEEIIPEILTDMVHYFNASKAYLMKTNQESQCFHCIKEVKNSPELASIKDVTPISFHQLGTNILNRLSNGQPIILSETGELPEDAHFIKSIFHNHNVRSAMLIPIHIDGFWGYAGIDIINRSRKWSNEDYKWFSSIIYIISLCTELHHAGKKTIQEKENLLQAQNALEKSEKILRNLYNNFPVGIELYDKNGILIDMNDKDVMMFGGQKKEDILGINIFDHPILLPEIKEKMRKREPVNFTSSFDCSMLPGYYRSLKNQPFELTTKISYLYNKQGELTNYMFINIDNLDTINAYKKIQEFEAYFAMIADYAKVGYYKWNPIAKEGFAIAQWFKNLGVPVAHELKDIKSQYINLHPDDLADIAQFYANAIIGKQKSFSKEIRIRKKDGKTYWLRSYKMVKTYNPENAYIEIVGMNFDITELKEVERKLIVARDKAQEADKLKTNFLANMSHEIRTPLNAIVGFSDILVEVDDEEEKKEYIDLVRKNSDLLLKLINDILDLSRIEAGKYEFIFEDVELYSLCHNAVESFNINPKENVNIHCNELTPFILHSDRNRLLQVINNLLSNALKFTNNGHINLNYIVLQDHVRFEVKDTGRGIPLDKCKKIFERFEKLDSFTQGTGLGLSICQQIIDKLNGEIGVSSVLGEGSTFWFTIPYTLIHNE